MDKEIYESISDEERQAYELGYRSRCCGKGLGDHSYKKHSLAACFITGWKEADEKLERNIRKPLREYLKNNQLEG